MTTGRINQVTTIFDAPFARPRKNRSARLRNELNRVNLHQNGQPRRSARTARDSSDLVATPATRATTQDRSTQTCLQYVYVRKQTSSHPSTKPTPIQRTLQAAKTQPTFCAPATLPKYERPSHSGQHPIKQPDLPTREVDALSPPSKTLLSIFITFTQATEILLSSTKRVRHPPDRSDNHPSIGINTT